MKILLLGLLLLPFVSKSQKISPPWWKTGAVYITTAKVSEFESKTGKTVSDKYKEAHVNITSNSDGEANYVTVDIPDYFYIKDAHVDNYSYEKKDGVTLTYRISLGTKSASVVIKFTEFDESIKEIMVFAVDDITAKPMKMRNLILYEIKE